MWAIQVGSKTFLRVGQIHSAARMTDATFEVVEKPFEIAIVLRSGHYPYRKMLRHSTPPLPGERRLADEDDSITLAGSSSSSSSASSSASSSDTPDECFDYDELESTVIWDYPGLGISIEVSPVGAAVSDNGACEEADEEVAVAEIMAAAMTAADAAAAEQLVDARDMTADIEVVSVDLIDSSGLETICEEESTAEDVAQLEVEALAAALGGDAPIGLQQEELQVLLQMRRQARAEEQRSRASDGPASDAKASPVVTPPPKLFEPASTESLSFEDLRKVWGDRQGTPTAPALLSHRTSRSAVTGRLADATLVDEGCAPAAAATAANVAANVAATAVAALNRVGLTSHDPEDLDDLDEIRCNELLGSSRSPMLVRVRGSSSSSPVKSTQLIWLADQLTRLAVSDGESSAPPSFTRAHSMPANVPIAARRPSFFFAAKRGADSVHSGKSRWRIRVRFMHQFKLRARRSSTW